MNPFGRLPLEIREMMISNLESKEVFWNLRRASPVFWRQSQTSKLLQAWDTLQKELDHHLFSQVLMLVKYPKIEGPILEDEHPFLMPDIFCQDPLFTPQQHLIFEMYDRYQGMLNCFALGPALVPLYRDKYPDVCLGRFSDFLARSFGETGEQLPTVMPPIEDGIASRIVYFLLAIDMIEQCPSAFVTSPGEPPKQRSLKEERSFKLVDHWLFMIPGMIEGDFERFLGLPERPEIAQYVEDFLEQEDEEEEEEEEQREAEEMVFIQC
ncbi:uncharacterized protein FPRO_14361 [Fusarium proliferatum ET1]|uniref:Uncharacterized protein n=1 Tax=Fusarium proliferatum (strain ET1) TaxID=1227346 RepID=A0A1L7VVY8_FUSPR|nr:uncharacterized protein FPRO_14361 [Fusarium proliferatum ET1]CZR44608.1 uncharacterized protein FPRO_14361 [Fusarium proliferatum ET1]